MLASTVAKRIAGWARRFPATSIGESIVALVLVIAIGGWTASAAVIINNLDLLEFFDNSSAGDATINNIDTLQFLDNSSAGNATINNIGTTEFLGSSSAGNAKITNLDFLQFLQNSSAENTTLNNIGTTEFLGSSSAGNAKITNLDFLQFLQNSSAENTTLNNIGTTEFLGSSSTGNAKITNLDFLRFLENSSAGNTTLNNIGTTEFLGSSSAGNAKITNLDFLQFLQNSSAGNTTLNNIGTTEFLGSSSAGNAKITNLDFLRFLDNSSAGNATINNIGTTEFLGSSSAGKARITNLDFLRFLDNSNAGNATINNIGAGTSTQFQGASTAANATITNRGSDSYTLFGAPIPDEGPLPSSAATAANATIINSGNNSFTVFNLGASGGNAALINANPTAFITIAELDGVGTAVGSIAGNGTIYLGSKNLQVGGNQQSTLFSGVISNGEAVLLPNFLRTGTGPLAGGSLTKVGAGTLTLRGVNTYTGGTNLNGGILAVNSDLNLGAGPLSFNGGTLQALGSGGGIISSKPVSLAAGGGTFLADTGTTSALSGLISGPGAWTKSGPGTLILSGANTYTGGTIINAGTLQLGNGGTTGGIVGNVLNNGVLTFNRIDIVSFSGFVSGTGVLMQVGSGTLALPNSNAYSGGTIISAGTILTQNASAVGTGPMTFGNGTTLQVQELLNVNGNWTVSSGSATVNGGLVQTLGGFNLGGGGTLIVNANFNVPGTANINSSGFVVNSAFTANDDINLNGSAAAVVNGLLTSPNVNVDNSSLVVNVPGTVAANVNVGPSALLGLFGRIIGSVVNAGSFQGTGVVNGNVVNNGIVSPGASIGTLTINGHYTQNASGTLRIEVAGASQGQYDVLVVNGRANIAGRLQLVRVGNFTLQVGNQITFLTASNGVSGTFSNVENDFLVTGSAIVFDVTYLPNGVLLEATQGSFAELASLFCGTPNAIAVGEALDSAVGDPRALELINFLNNENLTDLCEDINLISPEQLTSIFVVGVSLANVQSANLERRMTDIRAGSSGFSGGFAINGGGPSFWEGLARVSGPEGKSGPAVFAPVPQNRWGVFATGLGEFTNVDNSFNASGYDLATGGFTMGVDYRIGSNFAVGLTGGYAYTSADLVNDSSIGVNGGKLGLYATAFGSGFYLDTAVIGGLSDYDTRRTALEGTARGETLGGELIVLVAGGYDLKKAA